MTIPKEVDIIVCGGGSSGCVPTGRLANLDHNLQVLLIEGGENNLNNPWVYRPGIYPRNMKLDSKTASFYYSRPSEWLDGRRAVVPCAHILGGGSSINFMMYTRASASDYDDFKTKGWTTKELIPLMKKHETYQRACNNRDIHGFEGPIKVSFGNYTYPIMQDFLRAAESQGFPVTDDLQDLTTGHGAEHWLKWINRDTGRRSDAASAYIHSLGTCSMAPKEGNDIVKHGVLDERLNVHGVKGLKVADLSVCPDNVGCNTYSTALLIGEKCAVLTGEDLGYSGSALDMKVPNYAAPGEFIGYARL